ncbi:3-hydroxyisobutyrate dehydrogenase [Acidipropionibacterium timonense]|uniref:3-hydroxyisobutyrate dehydrogenase n=1 Tax=Acidipropionibacterium timonense TaxID=2161818 RepID=UPI00102F77E2|nr:3-hydroxyisobutyrate dehydrogenase [Acidipropionibacterium timonense]
MSTIAFLGLGNMGGPMAANLVRAGHDVRGFDPVPAAQERARDNGVTICPSGTEAASGADVVVTMFPNGAILLDSYQGGLIEAAPSALFIDSSTIDVAQARRAGELVRAAGGRFVDAPVSGGITGATQGTLTFMVGGDDEDLEAARPTLEAMGRTIVHCGVVGAGQAVKLCNNMVLGVTMIAVSEAFVLAESLGVSDDVFFDVASHATASCWALNSNCPVPGQVETSPANRGFAPPGFLGALMSKDLGLALSAIDQTGTDARMGRLAAELYRDYAAGEGAGRDFGGIIESIRERSGGQQ